MMKSLHIGKIFGAKVLLHWSFVPAMIILGFVSMAETVDLYTFTGFLGLLTVLFSILLIRTFLFIGMAKMRQWKITHAMLLPFGITTEERRKPALKAIYMTLILTLLFDFVLLFLLFNAVGDLDQYESASTLIAENISAKTFLVNLFLIQGIITITQLIPVFPFANGYIIKAFFDLSMEQDSAVKTIALISQSAAWVALIFGVLLYPVLLIVALVLFIGGQVELEKSQQRVLSKNYVKSRLFSDIN